MEEVERNVAIVNVDLVEPVRAAALSCVGVILFFDLFYIQTNKIKNWPHWHVL